jgi:hypothetical protein
MRKCGALPYDFTAEDEARSADNVERLNGETPEEYADEIAEDALTDHVLYNPISLWDGQEYYLEMMVEKIDLKTLFSPICRTYHVPIRNARGSCDINSRCESMKRFQEHEQVGRKCVLLYCGDHDPSGLLISDVLHSNLAELADAVGWNPANLIIDRFGLNAEFIRRHRLSWIDNLLTGSGEDLNNPNHPDHYKPYVQDYLKKYGPRKVEANALVTRPEAGRRLCREAIEKYLDLGKIKEYRDDLATRQQQVLDALPDALQRALSKGE